MITVLGIREAFDAWPSYDAVISIEDVGGGPKLRLPETTATDHLILQFHDLDHDDGKTVVCSFDHVRSAIDFARKHHGGRLLVHCHAGKCRSPGIALAILADRLGPGLEDEAVRRLLEIRKVAAPNLVVLSNADAVLERDGRLSKAWMAYEDGNEQIAHLRRVKQELWERFWAKGGK